MIRMAYDIAVKPILVVMSLLLSSVLFAQNAFEEGLLPPGAWEGVVITNPGQFPAAVTLSLRRNEQVIEQMPLELAPGQTRVIRMDRLFVASAEGATIAFRSSQRIELFGYKGDAQVPAATVIVPRRRAVRSPGAPVLVKRTVTLAPSKDNTLYQDPNGTLSNGAGPHLFAGSTGSRLIRRALVAFDVASQIPPGAQVTRVVLTLRVSQTIAGAQSMAIHRVTQNWGEAASNAGFSRDGIGTSAQAGDATWIHTFSPNQRWSRAGGDFDNAADATATAGSVDCTWESPAMLARVQQWLDQPATNFGWIVRGNESASSTAKRFDSRELAPSTTLPALTVEFNARQ